MEYLVELRFDNSRLGEIHRYVHRPRRRDAGGEFASGGPAVHIVHNNEIVGFRSAKARPFAEQKATFLNRRLLGSRLGDWAKRPMTLEQFRNAWLADPFRPFAVVLGDGTVVPVWSRDLACRAPSGRMIVVCQPDGSWKMIELRHVKELKFDD